MATRGIPLKLRSAPKTSGVASAEFALLPVVLHPALAVEAAVLGARAIMEVGDVLGAQRVQPTEPLGTGQGEYRAVRPVDDHRVNFGGALFSQRVAVVPHRAGIG